MRRLLLFILSFAFFYFTMQWVTGYIVTALHTATVIEGGDPTVSFGFMTSSFIFSLLPAILAFFVTQLADKQIKKQQAES